MEDFNICAECMFRKETDDVEYICTAYRTVEEANKVRKVRNSQTACGRFYSPEIPISKLSAITWHREMWNWIADNVEEIKPSARMNIKDMFLDIYEIKELKASCFCCEFCHDDETCDNCPIEWDEKYGNCKCVVSEYGDFRYAIKHRQYKEANEIARKIAELPEAEN